MFLFLSFGVGWGLLESDLLQKFLSVDRAVTLCTAHVFTIAGIMILLCSLIIGSFAFSILANQKIL